MLLLGSSEGFLISLRLVFYIIFLLIIILGKDFKLICFADFTDIPVLGFYFF